MILKNGTIILTTFTCMEICFFFQAEDGIRDRNVTGVQTCALPISRLRPGRGAPGSAPTDRSAPGRQAHSGTTTITGHHAVPMQVWFSEKRAEIGRASCRERVEIAVGAGQLKKSRGVTELANSSDRT